MEPAAVATVFLIPTVLAEGQMQSIPAYVKDAVQQCQVFFVENERTARRFLKLLWKEMVIDNYAWHIIHKAEPQVLDQFAQAAKDGYTIGIISEAGCPGVADPGQVLVARAHELGATVKPLVGPSSLLLALMASGMNGQHFRFNGYLPIDAAQRRKAIARLEEMALRDDCTQLFIETPYRNDQLLSDILQTCRAATRLCIAADLTASSEFVQTHSIADWHKKKPALHKRPAIFILGK
jgi:16S rRNA (cytidine1402-2'-O)-methyltransferase